MKKLQVKFLLISLIGITSAFALIFLIKPIKNSDKPTTVTITPQKVTGEFCDFYSLVFNVEPVTYDYKQVFYTKNGRIIINCSAIKVIETRTGDIHTREVVIPISVIGSVEIKNVNFGQNFKDPQNPRISLKTKFLKLNSNNTQLHMTWTLSNDYLTSQEFLIQDISSSENLAL